MCSKTYCCYDSKSDKIKFSNKGLNKRTLEDNGYEPMTKYRRVFDEAINLKSTNRGFKISNHLVGTYEKLINVSVTFTQKGNKLMMEYILSH